MNLTKEQRDTIKNDARLICVDAAAGSGKTHILVERIVHLLEHSGARLDGIVAFTFMEKAAAEMKARLRRRFRERALDPGATPEQATRWRGFERGVDAARVSTIHAFCMAVLRENALRLGADPDAAVLGDGEADLLAQQAVTGSLHAMLHEGNPNALRLVVEHGSGAAGDALHGVLRRRAVFRDLCASLPMDDPAALLAEWRRRCADEFARRMCGLRHSWTLHGLLRKLRALDGFCDSPGEPREARRLKARDAFDAIAGGRADADETGRLLASLTESDGRRANKGPWTDEEAYKATDKVLGAVKKFAEKAAQPFAAKDPQTDADAAQLAVDFAVVARRVIEAHDAAKRTMNTMDYDDLIERTRAALRDDPALCARVAGGIRYLLIDEFQDTDGVQFAIAESLAGCPGGPALFVVGDPKQSIYLFRGADVGLFREVNKQAAAGGAALPLPKNFRSLPDVLGFVNKLFFNSGLLAAVEDYKGIATERAAVGDGPRIEVYVTRPGDGGRALKVEEQAQAEADYLARRVRVMVESAQLLPVDKEGKRRPAGYGDIAVLFRKTAHMHLYEEALRRAGVPYCRAAGEGFYERQEIMDVLHLLKAVTDPWNEPALLAFLRSPMALLNDDEIVRLRRAGGVARAFHGDAIPEGFARPERLAAARALLNELRGIAELPCGAFLRRALELTHYEPVLMGQYQGLQKVSNLRKLVGAADNFARRAPAGLRGFVQYLDDLRGGTAREGDANLQAEGGDAVVLLTVHKAKGLEFPIVFVADMGGKRGGHTPSVYMHAALGLALNPEDEDGEKSQCAMALAIRDRNAREEEAEEARTLYVALTRARDYLVLMGPPDPKPDSWFGVMDRVFGVGAMAHGAAFNGRAWQGVVCRDLPAELPVKSEPAPDAGINMDRLRARIAPIALASAPERKVFSVSEVLNQLFGDGGEEERGGTQTGEQRQQSEEDRAGRSFAMARGTLAHRLFEDWDFASGAPPDLDELVKEARLGLTHRARLREELEAMAKSFREHRLSARLAADPALKREEPFVLALGGVAVRGTIDALLADGTVIDYKTGRPQEGKSERYEVQLALYAAAVRRLLGIEPREGLLYYADHGELAAVPLDAAAVESALARAEMAVRALRGG
jgi:ATP-dependent helicase/nuclease subunit A